MRFVRQLPMVVMAVWLAGCATMAGDCDPTGGGILRGMACASTGGFDERIRQREAQQTSLLEKKAELASEQSRLEAQRDEMSRLLAAKQAAYERSERELATVRGRIASGRGDTSALQAQAKRLEGELAQRGSEVDALEQTETKRRARIAELEREQSTLNQEFKALTER